MNPELLSQFFGDSDPGDPREGAIALTIIVLVFVLVGIFFLCLCFLMMQPIVPGFSGLID